MMEWGSNEPLAIDHGRICQVRAVAPAEQAEGELAGANHWGQDAMVRRQALSRFALFRLLRWPGVGHSLRNTLLASHTLPREVQKSRCQLTGVVVKPQRVLELRAVLGFRATLDRQYGGFALRGISNQLYLQKVANFDGGDVHSTVQNS